MTQKILEQRLGPDDVTIIRSGKRGRSNTRDTPPKKTKRRVRRGGGKRKRSTVEVGQLRYSQFSCSSHFSCGRPVSLLVQHLLDGKVKLSAPFLRLTVFETTDERTHEPVLRCIDNRRLFALKEYARRSKKARVMVNIEFFSQNTLNQVQRFMRNSDET